jgi:hypothetical protein
MLGLILAFLILPGPAPALFDDPAAESLVRKALEATYALRLDEARMAAQELETRYPDHPAGFVLLAETYWWEAQQDPGNSKVESDYYHAQSAAQQKAETAVKKAKYYQPELLANLATAHRSYARFQVTQKESYFSALRAGLRAHRYADQAFMLDKKYFDVYVSLGAFNYFAGTLPSMIKPFAWLFGAHGDKDLGVEQLMTAMEKAPHSRTEARIVYYSALLSNKEYSKAFPVLEQLMTDYPDNHVFFNWVTEWFREQRQNLEGAEYFERVYQAQLSRSPAMARQALLQKANLQLAHARKADALQTVQRIRAIPEADPLVSRKVLALEKAATTR